MIRDGSRVMIGGKRNKRSMHKLLSKKNKTTKRGGGCGCAKQSGGRVMKPAEFYGGTSGRYFSEGSEQLKPFNTAYGMSNPVSFGVTNIGMTETGPNLAPGPGSSGMMTGGKRKCRKNSKGRRHNKRKTSKKSTKRKCRK